MTRPDTLSKILTGILMMTLIALGIAAIAAPDNYPSYGERGDLPAPSIGAETASADSDGSGGGEPIQTDSAEETSPDNYPTYGRL